MRFVTPVLALGYALLVSPTFVGAQSTASRSLSFDTRYAIDTYSNAAFAGFGIEALDLAAAPAEAITLEGSGGNIARALVLAVGTDFVSRAYKLSYHEFGHGTRAAAAGFRPHFGYGEAPPPAELDEILAAGGLHEDFFSYFFGSFFRGGGYTYLPAGDVLFPPAPDAALDATGWSMVWRAGGLNNDMFFAQRLEDRIRAGGGHAGMLSSWFRSKISAARYANGKRIGDVDAVLDWYDAQGLELEQADLRKGSVISLMFSATSYELIYRFARVFAGDPIRYQGWAPYGVELPNVSFYMNAAGLSYQLSTGYRRGRWRIPVAVERVFHGRTRTEFTVGGEWGPGPYHFGTRVTVGERLGAAISVDRRFGDRFLVSGGYALYDTRNLFGERMIPSLESGPRYHDVFVRLGLVY